MDLEPRVEGLLRELAPRVLAALTRRYGHFDLAEDAVQEAMLAAATTWSAGSATSLPDNPAGWLTTVATRRLTDLLRSEQARHRRERTEAVRAVPPPAPAPEDARAPGDHDDSLVLLFLCCHPAITPPAQVALTLRAVGGLSTAEIARCLLLPEATITRRITRAKHAVLAAGARFTLPEPDDRAARLDVVLHVVYLVFTEGHTATAGDALTRGDLCAEAIRLGRMLRRMLPEEPEVGGLLAQMLLTDARRAARTGPTGELVPLATQDRSRWDRTRIAEGIALVTESLGRRRPGPYQLQAAVNAVHAEAATYDDTDWPQILALYGVLDRLADDPMVTLNRAVALAQVRGPDAGLDLLETAAADPRLAGHHRVHAVRAHLLHAAGRLDEAAEQYRAAARRTLSTPERQYLLRQAARTGYDRGPVSPPGHGTRTLGDAMPGGIEGAYELTAEATDGEDLGVESHVAEMTAGAAASSADPIPDPPIGGESIGVLVEDEAATSDGITATSPGPAGTLAKGAGAAGPV